MGVPTSEVGYTIATTRNETTKVRKNMWWHWGKRNSRLLSGCHVDVVSVYDRRYDFNEALTQLPLTLNSLSSSSRNSIVFKTHVMRIISA